MTVRRFAVLAVLVPAGAVQAGATERPDPAAALVKVYVAAVMPDAMAPWRPGWSYDMTGSGAVIEGGRIVTNAHVVTGHTFVQVRFHGSAEKHAARVSFISQVADLALLEMEDPAALAGVVPLEFGELPAIQDEVVALGFPTGGDTLSITRGVVARVEHTAYVQSWESLLAIQMDAAIAPGSSGGPLVRDGRLVGVAMQSSGANDTIGCAVPVPVVLQFLRDVEDGRLDGVPALGIGAQTLENPALKRSLGVPEGVTGVLVRRVNQGAIVGDALRPGDVLTSVDGRPIADDGTVEFRARERTDLRYGLQLKQVGEEVSLGYLRDGRTRLLRVRLAQTLGEGELVPRLYEKGGDYYIFGGLAFLALTRDYVSRAYQIDSFDSALTPHLRREPVAAGEQVVILERLLTADVNRGYDDARGEVILTVDGHPILNLAELVARVEGSDEPFVTFGYRNGGRITLDRREARRVTPGLLERHGLARDRSPDLEQEAHHASGSVPRDRTAGAGTQTSADARGVEEASS